LNGLDRFHLAMDAADRAGIAGTAVAALKRTMEEQLMEHRRYINQNGQDLPDIRNWRWDNPPRPE